PAATSPSSCSLARTSRRTVSGGSGRARTSTSPSRSWPKPCSRASSASSKPAMELDDRPPANLSLLDLEAGGKTLHLLFRLGSYLLALPLAAVESVERPGRVTAVPFAAPWLRGVTAVRGEVLSVVDLGLFAGVEPAGRAPGARLIVTRAGDVAAALPATPQPAPLESGPLRAWWGGVHRLDGTLVPVLDPQQLLTSAAFQAY